jgi:cytochrome c553
MRAYSPHITLTKNSRGIYSLDTVMGCASGMANEPGGCYGDCYAANASRRYGYDFSTNVLRSFESEAHRRSLVNRINRIPLDFVRIGSSGDPSEDWKHTVGILKGIEKCNKQIVIITRHWHTLTDEQLAYFGTINVVVNTSVSALDKAHVRHHCVEQHNRMKAHCKAILRVVSCDFNMEHSEGHRMARVQADLFRNDATLDTVFRPNKRNPLVSDGVVKVERAKFMDGLSLVSRANRSTYLGKCGTCHEMCGLNVKASVGYPAKPGTVKQLTIFRSRK